MAENGKAVAIQDAAPPPVIVVEDAPGSFLEVIKDAAKDPAVDTGKMEVLYNLHKQLSADQAEKAFNRDYMAAKMEMPRITKEGVVEYPVDKTNPDGAKKKAFKFAKYEDIDKAIKPIERNFGFARIFTTDERQTAGGGAVVHCTLLHKDGHSMKASIAVSLDASGGKNNIQAMASSFSYGKRYTTTMLWDIITENEDNDGNFDIFPIDEAQFTELQRLIDESGSDTAKFCKHIKVESLKAITNKQYPKAVQDLKAKIDGKPTKKEGK